MTIAGRKKRKEKRQGNEDKIGNIKKFNFEKNRYHCSPSFIRASTVLKETKPEIFNAKTAFDPLKKTRTRYFRFFFKKNTMYPPPYPPP